MIQTTYFLQIRYHYEQQIFFKFFGVFNYQINPFFSLKIQCVHEGLKNHVCDLCGKRFGVVSSLLKHKRIQHEGQKHPCDLCDKSFCEAYHLKIHISADHEGQKNFKCEFCEKSFGRPKKLRIHIKNAHGKL